VSEEKARGSVLQFEVDRKRWTEVNENDISRTPGTMETQTLRLRFIARTAVNDVIRNGGTFVLVVTEDKITMVQRPDAEEI